MIVHVMPRDAWMRAQTQPSWGQEDIERCGCVHCSTLANFGRVAPGFADGGQYVMVCLDPRRVTELRYEDFDKTGVFYPHVYAPIPQDAVVGVVPLAVEPDVAWEPSEDLRALDAAYPSPQCVGELRYAQLLEKYLRRYPQEETALAPWWHFALDHSDASAVCRKTPIGHYTAGAFLIAEHPRRVAMVHHAFLKKWLQPGGHIEPADAGPDAAALRELCEETGFVRDRIRCVPADASLPAMPLHIDAHPIPANPAKGEGPHAHCDFQYLFLTDCAQEGRICPQESTAFRWVPWEEFAMMPEFSSVREKIERVLEERGK